MFFYCGSNRSGDGRFDPTADGINEATHETQRLKLYPIVVLVVAVARCELFFQDPEHNRKNGVVEMLQESEIRIPPHILRKTGLQEQHEPQKAKVIDQQ